MDWSSLLGFFGTSIYVLQGLLALWGVYCVIFVTRQMRRRRFGNSTDADAFIDTVRVRMEDGDFDGAIALAEQPANVYRALPILVQGALTRRHLSPGKLRQFLASKLEREIMTPLENYRTAIDTIAKSAPMLGLLGTVAGMIGAFNEIGSAQRVNTQVLAGNISLALITTAVGLVVAIPLVIASSSIAVRMRAIEDSTVDNLQIVLEDLEAIQAEQG